MERKDQIFVGPFWSRTENIDLRRRVPQWKIVDNNIFVSCRLESFSLIFSVRIKTSSLLDVVDLMLLLRLNTTRLYSHTPPDIERFFMLMPPRQAPQALRSLSKFHEIFLMPKNALILFSLSQNWQTLKDNVSKIHLKTYFEDPITVWESERERELRRR